MKSQSTLSESKSPPSGEDLGGAEPIIDPRIKRLDLEHNPEVVELRAPEGWITYEVFHQRKRGEHHSHVGIVHAPDAEMALLFAKEQYGRRLRCTNLWVVRSADIYSFSYDDEDMFENNLEKNYRDASGFKVRDKINQFKKEEKTASPNLSGGEGKASK